MRHVRTCTRPRDRWPSVASPVRFRRQAVGRGPSAIGAIPEAFLALLARSKSKDEPAYGALGGRQVGTLHHLVVGFWCVAGSGETGVAGFVRNCAVPAATTCIEHAYGTPQRLSFQIKVF